MTLKIYKIDYEDHPSSAESSIVLAESIEEAKGMGMGEIDEIEDIQEIPKEKGKIYTGYYCC